MKKIVSVLAAACLVIFAHAQDMTPLVNKLKAKLDQVNDYQATGILKTDIAFIKAPVSRVKVYFKKPNRFRLVKDGGISILPKGGLSVTLNNVIDLGNFVALSSGDATVEGFPVKIVKVLPGDDANDLVLATLYIDEKNLLVRKANITTRENGTYDLSLSYGKYSSYGLADKVVFSFNTKNYKLPKGVTLEFNDDAKSPVPDNAKNKKGTVEISYSDYTINKGFDDNVFK